MRRSAATLSFLLCVVCAACSRRAPSVSMVASAKSNEGHPPLPSATLGSSPLVGESAPLASGAPGLLPAEERTWKFESTPLGRMEVVVLLPERAPDSKWPVLITMHGRGEALKGPERGARGWVDDYELGRALRRVKAPPLTREDFKGFIKEPRRTRLNAALSATPYRGFIVVCPYTPDMLTGDDPFGKAAPLANFLVDELLARVYRETPAIGSVETTGIDGVSLGGRAAISVGLLRPRAFGVIASMQAAFHADKAGEIAARALKARAQNAKLRFRVLTSDEDVFLGPDTAIADAMRAAGVPVEFDVVTGPHDYDFNRGPGAFEMLLFHDRALRGEPGP